VSEHTGQNEAENILFEPLESHVYVALFARPCSDAISRALYGETMYVRWIECTCTLLARTHIVSSEGDRLGAGAAFLPTETMFACATAGVTAGCAAACDARLAGLGSATGCCRHRRGSNGVTLVRYGNTARARTRMVTYAYRAPWQNEHTIHGERRARQRKGDVMCVGLMMMM